MGLPSKRRRKEPACTPAAAGRGALGACPNCGQDTSVLDAFCPKCGTVLSEEE